jgi:hypothetical protein
MMVCFLYQAYLASEHCCTGYIQLQLPVVNSAAPALLYMCIRRGQEVKIRLRPAGREGSFYDWNHVLGTMLHELCHNRIGPHNAEFYTLLDELWNEAEELMDKGISGTGQGFDRPSAGRLGAHGFIPTHNPPEHKMADAIRKVGGGMDSWWGGCSIDEDSVLASKRVWCVATETGPQLAR